MRSIESYELDVVHNSSEVSHIEMNFQNQESRPSGQDLDNVHDNSMHLRDDDGQPQVRNEDEIGYRGNLEGQDSPYDIDDNRNRMSYLVSNQDGRPQSSMVHNP